MHILTSVAKENHVVLITGYTNFKNVSERNSALVIDTDGNAAADYNKVHLVRGLENQFTPGEQTVPIVCRQSVQEMFHFKKQILFTPIMVIGLGLLI